VDLSISLIQEFVTMNATLKAALTAAGLILSAPSFAEETHHPEDTPAQAAPVQGRMGMMGGDGMSAMMPMMGMMRMMQGPAHVEGRIAFLKAELKITEAQDKPFADFAAALRQAAGKMRGGQMDMMGMAAGASLLQHLEHQEKQLTARLDAVRSLKTPLAPLHAALSEEQRKTLAQLHPMFMGMM
jgi:hypothetical protein